jgi:hypothetical protein
MSDTNTRQSKARNVTAIVEGDELVIRMNLKDPGVPSSTGKSQLIASTGGFFAVPGQDKTWLSLNLSRGK